MTDVESMLRDFEWAVLNREIDERNQGLMGRAARAQQRIVDEMAALARDRDLWKERHDRERAAHAKNLTEQQKCETERDRLREALKYILWVKDCGIDGDDGTGRCVNFADEERDLMYATAKKALGGDRATSSISENTK